MSRIGTKSITIPSGVTVEIAQNKIIVKGSKGELHQSVPAGITLEISADQVTVTRTNNHRQTKTYHGLIRSLVQNMIIGVSDGFSKKLELVGTGYRAKKQGKSLVLNVGYSNPVEYSTHFPVSLELEGDTVIIISGADKQHVGQVAAEIRKIRKPEPYKGKGIRYQDEVIRRKAGKSTKVGSAG